MHEFIIFYAPFIILIVAIVVAFLIAPMDGSVTDKEE
ncbi:cytochrome bd oxidase small subunit CydS [Sporosarcina sp. 179-K 8C2 HS]